MYYLVSVLFYFLFVLKICLCSLYIDIKKNYITPGIIVFHGYYHSKGSYKLFIGENESIQTIKYDDQVIFPDEQFQSIQYYMFVELFHRDEYFIILHLEPASPDIDAYTRLFYIIKDKEIEKFYYYPRYPMNQIIVRLSLDIDPNAPKHPFIKSTITHTNQRTEQRFEIVEEYKQIRFRGKNAPQYAFGNVFHSNLPVYVLLSQYDLFIDKCQQVLVRFSNLSFEVEIRQKSYYMFRLENNYNEQIFKYIGESQSLSKKTFLKAIRAKDVLLKNNFYLSSTFLDISENVSPSLFGIVRNSGIVGLRGYVLYDVKDYSKGISYIIDTTVGIIMVQRTDKNERIMFVEVFVEHNSRYLIVNSEIDRNGIKENKVEMFYRENYDSGYYQLVVTSKTKQQKILKDTYPIILNLDLGQQVTTFVYQRITLNDDEFNFIYFYINDIEYFSENIRSKYIFGSLSEINPYDVGNIPSEKFLKNYRIIRENLECQEFLIRNPIHEKPVDPLMYEIYTLVK